MIFPGIKIGDVVTIDGDELECTGVTPSNIHWFQLVGTSSYFYITSYDNKRLEELWNDGRIKMGKYSAAEKGGNAGHWHTWKRYTGLNKVLDVCDCGAEKEIPWDELGDGKRKSKKGT